MTGSPARSVSGPELEGVTAHGFADLPSGDPLAVLTLRERCVFLLRAYRFSWADIARLLHTKNHWWIHECARRAQGKLERRAAGRSFGLPEGLTPGGLAEQHFPYPITNTTPDGLSAEDCPHRITDAADVAYGKARRGDEDD